MANDPDATPAYTTPDLTPDVIRSKRFATVERGYDPALVEEFLEQVASAMEVLLAKPGPIAVKAETQRLHEMSARIIDAAHDYAQRAKEQSAEEAREILEDAKRLADELRKRAREHSERNARHVDDVRSSFVQELRDVYDRVGATLYRLEQERTPAQAPEPAQTREASAEPAVGSAEPAHAQWAGGADAPETVDADAAPGGEADSGDEPAPDAVMADESDSAAADATSLVLEPEPAASPDQPEPLVDLRPYQEPSDDAGADPEDQAMPPQDEPDASAPAWAHTGDVLPAHTPEAAYGAEAADGDQPATAPPGAEQEPIEAQTALDAGTPPDAPAPADAPPPGAGPAPGYGDEEPTHADGDSAAAVAASPSVEEAGEVAEPAADVSTPDGEAPLASPWGAPAPDPDPSGDIEASGVWGAPMEPAEPSGHDDEERAESLLSDMDRMLGTPAGAPGAPSPTALTGLTADWAAVHQFLVQQVAAGSDRTMVETYLRDELGAQHPDVLYDHVLQQVSEASTGSAGVVPGFSAPAPDEPQQ